MTKESDEAGELRPDGGNNVWVSRLVNGPVRHEHGRYVHGGQIVARCTNSRAEALAMAGELAKIYAPEVRAGARLIIEPGVYSRVSMPGAVATLLDAGDIAVLVFSDQGGGDPELPL